MAEKTTVKLTLTPEQQAQIAQATGRQVSAVQLRLNELEQRLAPALTAN